MPSNRKETASQLRSKQVLAVRALISRVSWLDGTLSWENGRVVCWYDDGTVGWQKDVDTTIPPRSQTTRRPVAV